MATVPLVVVQPTSLCNLNCRYCYVPNRRDRAVMSAALLRRVLMEIATTEPWKKEFEVQWHAGEPLAAGKQFFSEAVVIIRDVERETGAHIHQSVQTNATLVDDWWASFFAENDFGVGVSIDGPEALHDRNRVNWNGRGSFASVMRGINCLRRRGLQPAALAVVTHQTLSDATAFFRFFRENGFTQLGLNVEEIENQNRTTGFDRTGDIEGRYYTFMRELFLLWHPVRESFVVREFKNTLEALALALKDQSFVREPDEIIPWRLLTISRTGEVIAYCPEFAGSQAPEFNNFSIGNLADSNLMQLKQSQHLAAIASALNASRARCRADCKFYAMCGGGYFSNKYSEHGDFAGTETLTCRLHTKALTNAVVDGLREVYGAAAVNA